MSFDNDIVNALFRILILGPVSLIWIACVVRMIGLRSFSKMTAFDFIITVATGSLLANAAVAGTWTSFFIANGAMLALLGTQATIAQMPIGSTKRLSVVENKPLVLMRDGVMDEKNMRAARVTETDLIAKLREANVFSFNEGCAVVL